MTLRCELSKKGVTVQWKREAQLLSEEIFRGKYEMTREGKLAQLTIINVQPEDAAKYSCIAGDEKTTAEVRVKRELKLEKRTEDTVFSQYYMIKTCTCAVKHMDLYCLDGFKSATKCFIYL